MWSDLLASTVGPAVTIAIFQTRSNTWTLGELRVVIYVGMGLETAAAFMMFLFSDKRALGKESDSLEAMEASDETGSKTPNGSPTVRARLRGVVQQSSARGSCSSSPRQNVGTKIQRPLVSWENAHWGR